MTKTCVRRKKSFISELTKKIICQCLIAKSPLKKSKPIKQSQYKIVAKVLATITIGEVPKLHLKDICPDMISEAVQANITP